MRRLLNETQHLIARMQHRQQRQHELHQHRMFGAVHTQQRIAARPRTAAREQCRGQRSGGAAQSRGSSHGNGEDGSGANRRWL